MLGYPYPPEFLANPKNHRTRSSLMICGPDGSRLARGLSAYASTDAERIAGHRSDEIEAILGWRGRDEIIHRDDLVLL